VKYENENALYNYRGEDLENEYRYVFSTGKPDNMYILLTGPPSLGTFISPKPKTMGQNKQYDFNI